MAPGEQPMDVGGRLLDLGCRQGALLDGPGRVGWFRRAERSWEWRDEPLAGASFVVASQDCDVKAPEGAEPFVELLAVVRVADCDQLLQARKGNSARRFLLAMDGDAGLVADARRRVLVEKGSLLEVAFSPLLGPPEAPARARFGEWLARRYSRAAIPQPLVDAVQKPVVRAIAKGDGELRRRLEGIDEILFRATGNGAPFDVDVVLLTEGQEPDPEDAAEVAGWMEETLVASGLVSGLQVAFRTPASLSVQDYTELTRLELDHFSEG